MRVSFDFDDTLSLNKVQEYAKWLVSEGAEVWIVTSRLSDEQSINQGWNKDLFCVADDIGIKRENIKFTPIIGKSSFFMNNDFLFHLDDDREEIDLINKYTKTKGVWVNDDYWNLKCEMIRLNNKN